MRGMTGTLYEHTYSNSIHNVGPSTETLLFHATNNPVGIHAYLTVDLDTYHTT